MDACRTAGLAQVLTREPAGKQVYTRYCAVCHGITAEGGSGSDISPPAPDLTDKEWKRGSTDGEIFSVIKNGVPPERIAAALNLPLRDVKASMSLTKLTGIGFATSPALSVEELDKLISDP